MAGSNAVTAAPGAPASAPAGQPQGHPILGSWREPPCIATAGESGSGKSTDAVAAFHEHAVYLCAHTDGVKVDLRTLAVPLRPDQVRYCGSVSGAIAVMMHLMQHEQGRYLAAIIDDGSVMADNELRDMKRSGHYNAKGNSFSFQLWTDLLEREKTLTDLIRMAGMFGVSNWHVRQGGTDGDGIFHRGGPAFPSLKHIAPFCHIQSSVWLVQYEHDLKPWPWLYRCEPDNTLIMKDRHNLRGKLPLNMAELLRHVGYNLPRHSAMPWQEEWVDRLATRILEGGNRKELATKVHAHLTGKGIPVQHADWTIRDGFARADLRLRRDQGVLAYL
jgi:hypothetical protein